MKAVILAGGLGSRSLGFSEGKPKCLLEIGKRPILFHQFDLLRKSRITDVLILAGNGADQIVAEADRGYDFGLNVTVIQEPRPLGTGGALMNIAPLLDDDFVLLFGDIFTSVELGDVVNYHTARCAHATLVLKASSDYAHTLLFKTDEEDKLTAYGTASDYLPNLSFAGIAVCSKRLFDNCKKQQPCDFTSDIITSAIGGGEHLLGLRLREYAKDIGTRPGYARAKRDYELGIFDESYRGAIFLDRDGVINRLDSELSFVNSPEEFIPHQHLAASINVFHNLGFKVVVVTNQGGIELGYLTDDMLQQIHSKLHHYLSFDNEDFQHEYVDGVYYCPHFHTVCDCRKPKPGMLEEAMYDLYINPLKSWMVGDFSTDMEAGKNFNEDVKTVLISEVSDSGSSDMCFPSLFDFARYMKQRNITAI
jgi:mannose-1-phosphate guanylyltransferase / phosphomannomutase